MYFPGSHSRRERSFHLTPNSVNTRFRPSVWWCFPILHGLRRSFAPRSFWELALALVGLIARRFKNREASGSALAWHIKPPHRPSQKDFGCPGQKSYSLAASEFGALEIWGDLARRSECKASFLSDSQSIIPIDPAKVSIAPR